MRGLVRRVSTGQRGFTLIELLVVVAILGIIAAVVVLNVAGFIGSGKLEAANTEAHQVQTAVVAAMADSNTTFQSGTVPGSTGADGFLMNPGSLKGTYTIGSDGAISAATWEDATLVWDNGEWVAA